MKHRKIKKRLDARRVAATTIKKDSSGVKKPGSQNWHKSFPVK